MNNAMHLEQRLRQQLTISPRQQQSLKLLQLPAVELDMAVSQIVADNPLLEEQLASGEDFAAPDASVNQPPETADESQIDENIVNSDLSPEDLFSNLPEKDAGEEEDDRRNALPVAERTLRDELWEELAISGLPEIPAKIAGEIIDALDANGFLPVPVADLAMLANGSAEEMNLSWQWFISVAPPGVGLPDRKSYLLWQLDQKKMRTPQWELLVTSGLPLVAKQHWNELRKLLQVDADTLEKMLKMLPRLRLYPADVDGEIPEKILVPEVELRELPEGKWEIIPLRPRHQWVLSSDYDQILSGTSGSDSDRKYFQSKLQEATSVLEALAWRTDTIVKVAAIIAREQNDYLRCNSDVLVPLSQRQIAAELQLSDSTVSRAIANKLLITPRGTLPMHSLLSAALPDQTGSNTSKDAVAQMLKRLIAEENPKHPWSDAELAAQLKQAGFPLSRRTVAKYREKFNIPSTIERKR